MKPKLGRRPIKISVLGSGSFCQLIKDQLASRFELVSQNADLVVVANYGQKIPRQELSQNRFLNVHASLLPALKGSSPVQTALIQGLKFTGYTIIQMDQKIDHGPILAQGKVKISPQDNWQTLADKIALLAGQKLRILIPLYLAQKISPRPQKHSQGNWTKKITDNDRRIILKDLKTNPQLVERKIRALFPKPKAYLLINHQRLIIHQAQLIKGRLQPIKVQLEGKKPLDWQEFLRGYRKKNILSY